MVRIGHYTLIGAAFGLLATFVIAGASAAGNGLPTKGVASPMTDQQMQQLAERNSANNAEYLAAVKRNHVNPKQLPIGTIPTAGIGPGTLSATRVVPLVIYGHVEQTEFIPDTNN